MLCAYGVEDADVLAACKIDGAFVPLRIPRSVVVALFTDMNAKSNATWAAELARFFERHTGPVSLPDLYRAFATHPKAIANKNYQAKLRQQLQQGPFRRLERGLWEAAS